MPTCRHFCNRQYWHLDAADFGCLPRVLVRILPVSHEFVDGTFFGAETRVENLLAYASFEEPFATLRRKNVGSSPRPRGRVDLLRTRVHRSVCPMLGLDRRSIVTRSLRSSSRCSCHRDGIRDYRSALTRHLVEQRTRSIVDLL